MEPRWHQKRSKNDVQKNIEKVMVTSPNIEPTWGPPGSTLAAERRVRACRGVGAVFRDFPSWPQHVENLENYRKNVKKGPDNNV